MSNTSDALADFVASGYAVPTYAQVFKSNPNIADAMGYSSLPSDLRTALWARFNTIKGLSTTGTVTRPAAYPTDPHTWLDQGGWNASTNTPTITSGEGTNGHFYSVTTAGSTPIDGWSTWTVTSPPTWLRFTEGTWRRKAILIVLTLTRAEALAIYVAKVAHAFWLDIHNMVPWKLASYNLEACQGLFDPSELFWSWDIDGATPAEFTGCVDFYPWEAYGIANTQISGPFEGGQGTALDLLMKAQQGTTQHASGNFLPSVSVADFYATANKHGGGYYWAPYGCHSMAPHMAALARSINIPALVVDGDGWAGAGHASAIFPTISALPPIPDMATPYTNVRGMVMGHGDDTYSGRLDRAYGVQALDPKGYWDDNIWGQDNATQSYHSQRLYCFKALRWISPTLLSYFGAGGWTAVYNEFSPSFSLPGESWILNRLHQDLIARNGGVDIP